MDCSFAHHIGMPIFCKRTTNIGIPHDAHMATDFGNRLKQARKLAGLTQVQLAKAVGVAQSTIAELERQRLHAPDCQGAEGVGDLACKRRRSGSRRPVSGGVPQSRGAYPGRHLAFSRGRQRVRREAVTRPDFRTGKPDADDGRPARQVKNGTGGVTIPFRPYRRRRRQRTPRKVESPHACGCAVEALDGSWGLFST